MATLSSKIVPSGVATAAQGALADTAVQPADIPSQDQSTWNTGTATTESLITAAKLDDKIENKLNVTGTAPMYAGRSWVNFNGTGTVAIRASGNVSSITDNGTGNYTVNFTTAMPDVDYATVVSAREDTFGGAIGAANVGLSRFAQTTSAVRVGAGDPAIDMNTITVAVFR